jgi:Tol biopolymer transport system component
MTLKTLFIARKSNLARLSGLSILLLIGLIFLPHFAAMQSNDAKSSNDAKNESQLAPQATRPDILWMRGGHTSEVWDVTSTPQAGLFATVGIDETVKIWRISDYALIRTIANHGIGSRCVALSKDGQYVAVGGNHGSHGLKVYRVSDGSLVHTFAGTQYGDVAFSPDGIYIAAVANNGVYFAMWRMSDGTLVREGTDPGNYGARSIAFSPNGNYYALINGNTNNPPALFNVSDGTLVRRVAQDSYGSIAFSPDGSLMAVGGGIFAVSNGALITSLGGSTGANTAFSPDGNLLAIGDGSASVRVFQVSNSSNWNLVSQFQSGSVDSSSRVTFLSNNNLLVGSSNVKVWNASTGALIRNVDDIHTRISGLAFSPDGQSVVTAQLARESSLETLRLRNVSDGAVRNISFPQSAGLNFNQARITADGQRIVTLDGVNSFTSVKIWNANDGSLIRNTSLGIADLTLVLTPDSQSYILSGVTNTGSFLTTQYRISDGTVIRVIGTGCIEKVLAVSPDGSTLATTKGQCSQQGDNGLRFYRISDGTVLRHIYVETSSYSNGVFSPNGQTFAVTGFYHPITHPKPIPLYRVSDGEKIREFIGQLDSPDGIDFSPDGEFIAATSWDNTVRMWRVSDAALLQTYDSETVFTNSGNFGVSISNIKFSPDGSRIVYGRSDATLVMARNPYPTTPPTNYTISGQIQRNGTPLSGVTVALSGNSTGSTTTDANGNYSFTVAEGGSYTVTPTLANNTISPQSATFNFISQNQTANFTASYITYTISGNVKADGANLSGALVKLSGAETSTVNSDANGNYSFTVSAGGNYTVSVYKSGYNFNPASQGFTNLQANQTANFQNGVPLCATKSSGLVAWYKGENDVVDSSGLGNNGGFFNGTFSAGKVGQAMNFNGTSNYVAIADSPSNSITGQITTAAWIKPTTITGFQVIMSKYGDGSNSRSFIFSFSSSGKLYFEVNQTNTIGRSYITNNVVLTAGVYQHVAATFNPATQLMEIFVNGVSVPVTLVDANTVTSIQDSPSTVRIGDLVNNAGQDSQFFNGQIDEAKMFNRALSTSEIAAIYNAGSAGVCVSSTFTPVASNGGVAFVSNRTGNSDIFYRGADGTSVTNLTNTSFNEGNPAWSPDGSKIAYESNADGNIEIYVMNSDGTQPVRLTNNAASDNHPSWSPDGSRIAFQSNRDGNTNIFVMSSADGSNILRLTTNPAVDVSPKWSPDGTRIAFVTGRDGNAEIYTMNTDGSSQTNITNNGAYDDAPDWSPDAQTIVFASDRRGNGVTNILFTNLNGGTTRFLTTLLNSSEQDPTFSPDGTRIVFQSNRTGDREIYSTNLTGGDLVRLTSSTSDDTDPTWQPIRANILITPISNVSLTFANVSQAGNTVATPIVPASAGALPDGYQLIPQSIAYDIRTSAGYTGNIRTTFNVNGVTDAATCASLRMLHYNSTTNQLENVTNGTNVYNSGTQVCAVTGQTTSLSPFVIALAPPPTAASAAVSGRVASPDGRGLRNARVTLIDSNGNSQSALTGSFGYFRFDSVQAGETYIITVASKRYQFAPQAVTVIEDLTDLNFTALE